MSQLLLLLLSASAIAQQQPMLLWAEEFNSGLNTDHWSFDTGGGGWGNGELQTYTTDASNVRVEDGLIKIIALRDGDSFTSARIKSHKKVSVRYGTIEASIKVPDVNAGLVRTSSQEDCQ